MEDWVIAVIIVVSVFLITGIAFVVGFFVPISSNPDTQHPSELRDPTPHTNASIEALSNPFTISVPLDGGLGNILFRVAVGLAYSKRHQCQLVFYDASNSPKPYWDNILKPFRAYWKPSAPSDSVEYKEPSFGFTAIPPIQADTTLLGYYQSASYFLDELPKTYWQNILRPTEALPDDTVSLHVRRGDYLNFKDIFIQNGIDYYKRAIDHVCLERHMTSLNIVVFSNDIDWCKAELAPRFPDHHWMFCTEGTDWEQLCTMTSARDMIITNSTYSWWAALGHQHPSGIVVAPVAWFGPQGPPNHSLYDKVPWTLL